MWFLNSSIDALQKISSYFAWTQHVYGLLLLSHLLFSWPTQQRMNALTIINNWLKINLSLILLQGILDFSYLLNFWLFRLILSRLYCSVILEWFHDTSVNLIAILDWISNNVHLWWISFQIRIRYSVIHVLKLWTTF